MNRKDRPLAVTVIAALYVGVGVAGFVSHFPRSPGFSRDDFWIELTEIVAILSGVFLLRGRDWARWLAVAWMVFHVVLSALNGFAGFALHLVLCAAIGWLLFRPESARYFRGPSGSQLI